MDKWPAMGRQGRESGDLRDWSDPSYLRRIAGRRTVPVEVGGCYTEEGWRQELMTVGDFLSRYIETNTCDLPPSKEVPPTPATSDTEAGCGVASSAGGEESADGDRNVHAVTRSRQIDESGRRQTAYLAQHQLFDQIPSLRRDVITPDYCALLLADEEDEANADNVAMNAWFGPGGTVSPLHNDPFHNILAQVVGTKKVGGKRRPIGLVASLYEVIIFQYQRGLEYLLLILLIFLCQRGPKYCWWMMA